MIGTGRQFEIGQASSPTPDVPYNGLAPMSELPPLDSTAVLNSCIRAHRALAELKGATLTMPNSRLLLQGLRARDVQASSAIEDVVTTNELLLQYSAADADLADPATKEALRYSEAVQLGSDMIGSGGRFSVAMFVEICRMIQTKVHDVRTRQVFIGNPYLRVRTYTPPDDISIIKSLLDDLARFMNDASSPVDPLVRMAVAHYQFEAIHPFEDGNGRTGRVLNVLYLQLHGLLDDPILYLSEFILQNRDSYYSGLRNVTFDGQWEEWVCYVLRGVEVVSRDALSRVQRIHQLRRDVGALAGSQLRRAPSEALLDVLFERPYCTVADVQRAEGVTRPTALRRTDELESAGILSSTRFGRHRLYFMRPLVSILTEAMPHDGVGTYAESYID